MEISVNIVGQDKCKLLIVKDGKRGQKDGMLYIYVINSGISIFNVY